MDKELVFKLIKWAKRKHPPRLPLMDNESRLSKDIGRPRFGHHENSVFVGLKTFAATPIERHNKVTGSASPFDGNWVYWVLRGRDMATRRVSLQYLVKRQKGQCAWCQQYLTPSEIIEVDHIKPTRLGGKGHYDNLQALHNYGHDSKTRTEKSAGR